MSKRGFGSSAHNNRNFSGVVAIEVTTKDGRRLSYRSRQGGFITGIDDAIESPANGRMTVPEIAKRMAENGATVKTYTKNNSLHTMKHVRKKSQISLTMNWALAFRGAIKKTVKPQEYHGLLGVLKRDADKRTNVRRLLKSGARERRDKQ